MDCAVCIVSSRESWPVLARTVRQACAATAHRQAVVDLVVNGNAELARTAAQALREAPRPPGPGLRVWQIALGDKSHAWNEYVHRIAPPAAGLYVFVDGYVHVAAGAVDALARGLAQAGPGALAVTGLPTVGATAAAVAGAIRADGGLHGNLHALRPEALHELRRIGFRLPKGLYRSDSTIAAVLSLGLNLHPRDWQPLARIAVAPDAHWTFEAMRWWRLSDLRAQFRRVVRQAQGALETAAVREHVHLRGRPFEDLPGTAAELVGRWLHDAPQDAQRMLAASRLRRRAWRALQQPRDWSAAAQPPQLLLDTTGDRR